MATTNSGMPKLTAAWALKAGVVQTNSVRCQSSKSSRIRSSPKARAMATTITTSTA
ncbi:hypothetical protein D3C72_2578910 [compost metagenome]